MQKPPAPSKGLHFLQLAAFAVLPVLLMTFVVPRGGKPLNPPGDGLLPIVVSCLSGSAAIFCLMTRLNADQEPQKFQTNMLITLALGELITLMGVFIGHSAGLPVIPFLLANYAVIAIVAVRVANYWMPRR